ncbi:FixJ family two-component response regulator [Pararhizobium capsulatum DSM 1112]|uniref:FixJ family two-component response regulator n=1 Tax=Pararhizobium capsulatum DSM 1112 TaxID=1121113 RepID=A0ABU0BZY0_9HYPH|nr:response regulator [Pararhizobium capsulatum]MDQ0323821.1 FixJ family two-component response regulator [Pararhizobium capsulatum DSM 1112]
MNPIIHIVDDDLSFRIALGRLLSASGYGVALYASGEELLARLPGIEHGCILLDLDMPGLSGLALQEKLSTMAPLLPIVFLTGHGDIKAGVQAMKAGADDFLEKPATADILLETIDKSLRRADIRQEEFARTNASRARLSNLTPREFEVLRLLVRGKLNKQIAHALGTSERTIKAHRHNLMEKIGARSLAEAVSIAERLGLVDLVEEGDAS